MLFSDTMQKYDIYALSDALHLMYTFLLVCVFLDQTTYSCTAYVRPSHAIAFSLNFRCHTGIDLSD